MASEDDKVKWWRQQSGHLPHWSSVVKNVLLVQPSSEAAERVFSGITQLIFQRFAGPCYRGLFTG